MDDFIEIDGHRAAVSFDPEIGLLRGVFLDPLGGADFYAKNMDLLREEGRTSLSLYFELCREHGLGQPPLP